MRRFISRKQLRLRHYDYSSAGIYFVTICVNNRQCIFGEVVNGQMILNDAGIMVKYYYHDLEFKFENIICGEYIIMPNHFHCLIHIQNNVDDEHDNIRADMESAPTVGVESISTHVSLPQII